MPFGDRTGPLGQGPMTGRGAGYCAGFPYPGYMNPYSSRGYFGGGRGRGWRRWWGADYPPALAQPTQAQEKEMLTQELEALKEGMKAIEQRLGELKGSKK